MLHTNQWGDRDTRSYNQTIVLSITFHRIHKSSPDPLKRYIYFFRRFLIWVSASFFGNYRGSKSNIKSVRYSLCVLTYRQTRNLQWLILRITTNRLLLYMESVSYWWSISEPLQQDYCWNVFISWVFITLRQF